MQAGLIQLNHLGAQQPLAPACGAFYFLRHGQTPRNAARIFQGPEEPLSALGQTQAARAAALLAGAPIRSIVCSDARRAVDTAQAVAAPHRLQPQARQALRERNFGALIGTSSAKIDWACEPEGGEALASFFTRTRAALAAALELPAPTLLVAHGGTLYVLAALLGVALDGRVLGNAQPILFARNGPIWSAEALAPAGDPALSGLS